MTRTPALFLSALALAIAAPAFAQAGAPPADGGGGERVNQVVVYGDDPCPQAQGDEIVVCGRLDESERYRIPEPLRNNPNDARNESWTSRVRSVERIGRFGTDSCSPTGLGGFTGCVNQLIADARAERNQQQGTSWTNAVSDARRERMQGFDAASEQVEQQLKQDEAEMAANRRPGATTGSTSTDSTPDAEPLPSPQSVRPSTTPDGATITTSTGATPPATTTPPR
jgi:hypothetical protein